MVERGDLVEVESEEYSPWFVVCYRVSASEASRVIKDLDVPEYTIKPAPPACRAFSVLLKGYTRDRAIIVPSEDLQPTDKSAWFLSGWA